MAMVVIPWIALCSGVGSWGKRCALCIFRRHAELLQSFSSVYKQFTVIAFTGIVNRASLGFLLLTFNLRLKDCIYRFKCLM